MADIHKIFIDDEGNLRSGWRVGVFLFFYSLLLGLLGTVLQAALVTFNVVEVIPQYVFWFWSGLLGLSTALLVGWQSGKWLERLPFRVLGASFQNHWLRNLCLGLLAGLATVSLAVAITYGFGGERFSLNLESSLSQVVTSLAISFIVFAVAAAAEEALFRGYILQTLDRAGYAWIAIVLTSATFGVVHLGNPNAGLISTLNTILAGVWFGIAYLRFRDLWFVTGMHLTWNWVQGSVFGIEVSGLRDISDHPILREIDTGPTWLTGETYGIEGGIAATFAILVSILALVRLKTLTRVDTEIPEIENIAAS